MPSLTIKGMPDELYRLLKQRAASNRRSLNSEILITLQQVVAVPPDAEALLARVDAMRETLRITPLTDARLRSAKAQRRC